MIDEDLVVPWSAQVRTDVARDPELLDLMHRSGCDRVYLGLESVNQATLDAFDKHQSVDDIVEAIRMLHEHGIDVTRHVRAGRRHRHQASRCATPSPSP